MVPGGRQFYVWQEAWTEQRRLLDKLRAAAQALANVPMKRGFNMWNNVLEEEREAKRKLLEAVRLIINSKAHKAFSQWHSICAAVNAKKEKMKAALVGFTPEGRAKKGAFRKIAWIRKRHLAMMKATAGFRLSGCRHALHAMQEQVQLMAKLRKGGAALFNRKARAAYSTWAEMALAGAARQRKMEAAMKRMTPEGRALIAGFRSWVELMDEVQNMRRALSGFLNGSLKRAMTAWVEATFIVRED